MRRFLLLLLVCLPALAWAGSWGNKTAITSSTQGSRVIVQPGAVTTTGSSDWQRLMNGRTIAPDPVQAAQGASLLQDLLKLPIASAVAGGTAAVEVIDVVAKRQISSTMAAKAIARGLPVVGTALAVKEVWDLAGCRVVNMSIECLAPAAEVNPDMGPFVYYEDGRPTPVYGSAGAACAALASRLTAQFGYPYPGDAQARAVCNDQGQPSGCIQKTQQWRHYTVNYCPNPANPFPPAIAPGQSVGRPVQLAYTGRAEDLNSSQPRPIVDISGIVNGQLWARNRAEADCPGGVVEGGACQLYKPGGTEADVERKINEKGPAAYPKLPAAVDAIDKAGIPFDTGSPTVTGPKAVPGGRVSTESIPNQSPGGQPTIRVTDRDWEIEYFPEGQPSPTASADPWVNWREVIRVKDYPPGTTVPPYAPPDPGIPPSTLPPPTDGGSTIIRETPPPIEVITCGLPTTPPCKIDEGGTPTADSRNPDADIEQASADWKSCLANPVACLPQLPDLNWSFSFPTSCSPIPIPGFSQWIESIDICAYQEKFHDIMSMIWAATGVFLAIRMVFRDSVGG